MIPSLQDIARMRFPASQAAMRRFYIPDWKREEQRPVEMESLFEIHRGTFASLAGGGVMPAATSTSEAARGARSAVGRGAGPVSEGASSERSGGVPIGDPRRNG